VFLSRRIDGPDGGLLGVVVAAIDMQYLASFLSGDPSASRRVDQPVPP